MRRKIPGATKYEVDENSVVYGPDGRVRNTYRNGDGYITTLIRTDAGDFVTTGVHRLVALAFKFEDKTPDKNHVNHLDGDIENNAPDNVDWETPANNNLHASLISRNGQSDRIVVVGKNELGMTNHLCYYSNLWEVSEDLGRSIGDTWKAFRDAVAIDGKRIFVNRNLGPEFNKPNIVSRDGSGRQPKRMLKMLNLETKEIVTGYASELARKFGVSTPHITTSVSDDRLSLFREAWLIVDEKSQFPEVDRETFDYLKERGKAKEVIVLVSDTTEHIELHPSAASFVRTSGLSKKSVTTQLKRSGIGKLGKYVFAYKRDFTVDDLRRF